MTAWANFGISKVRYDSDHNHIIEVKRRKDSGEIILDYEEPRARKDVVADINAGVSYVTIYKTEQGKWKKGDSVGIVRVDGVEYIRTDGNQTAKDNLGNLPEY